MKSSKILITIFCTLASFPGLASDSFQSLQNNFNNSATVTTQDLNGSFVGTCYINPVQQAYINRKRSGQKSNSTSTTILIGKQYNNGLHAAMLMTGLDGLYPETQPGANREKYIELFKSKPEIFEKVLESMNPIALVNGDIVTNFLDDVDPALNNGQPLKDVPTMYIFKKNGNGLISEVVSFDSRVPKELNGVQQVCAWFDRIQ